MHNPTIPRPVLIAAMNRLVITLAFQIPITSDTADTTAEPGDSTPQGHPERYLE